MKKNIKILINQVDKLLATSSLAITKEKPSLITFLFHKVFRNNEEIYSNEVNPIGGITIEHFRQFVEYYLHNDYLFISPYDILNNLNNNKKYILITFDDGYFNNSYILPTLNEFKIPAVFSISTNYINYNKCFWWDVLYKEGKKRGYSDKAILKEEKKIKLINTVSDIDNYMNNMFGRVAFNPVSDIDRPFTKEEFKDFSKEKYVLLGNHTKDHLNLTQQSISDMKTQIIDAQETIHDITGIRPIIISFPYGEYNNEAIKISKENGLKLGITSKARKNYFPINFHKDAFRLGRFAICGNEKINTQCKFMRSDLNTLNIYTKLLNMFKK